MTKHRQTGYLPISNGQHTANMLKFLEQGSEITGKMWASNWVNGSAQNINRRNVILHNQKKLNQRGQKWKG